MGVVLIATLPHPSLVIGWLSLFYPIYYIAGSVVYHLRSA
jgi:hypothetical protein